MTDCAECGDDFPQTFVCSVCGGAYCRSHRGRADHDCVEPTNPGVRPLSTDDWSWVSYAVEKVLFVVLSASLLCFLVELLS